MDLALGSRKFVAIAWPGHSLDLSQAKQLKPPGIQVMNPGYESRG